ncbi:MAG: AraC family transcriptional regulator [Polyangiales bacterium]
MNAKETASQPCYSVRLVHTFLRVLQRDPRFPPELLAPLEALDPDDRLPIVAVHELLQGAVLMTGDPDLGLKAAREISPGDYGALEYAICSAATLGDGLEVCARYMRLVNDALDFSLRIEGERAIVQLDSGVVLPRSAADFQSAAFHISGLRSHPSELEPHYEVWFTHSCPASVDEYERTFVGGVLRFDAPWNGFTFDRRYLELPMPTSDPKLHDLIRKHAELLLAELPRAESMTEKVRDLIAKELEGGSPSVATIAHRLHTSPRTLGRKLEHEGASFKELLDDLRRRLALRYVGGQDLGLSEIAFLLGFSQSAAFHRAFKRWTGQTPLEYRRARRG